MTILTELFLLSKTKNCVPHSSPYQQKTTIIIKTSKQGYERSVYWNEYKGNRENKHTTNGYRYFLESNFLVVICRLFDLIYPNQNDRVKRFDAKNCYLLKRIITRYVIINGKNFYYPPIDSDTKR